MSRAILLAPAVAVLLGLSSSLGAELNGIRGPTPLTAEPAAAPLPSERIGDQRYPPSFPEQPPVVPHPLRDDYRIDLSEHECLWCHSRTQTAHMAVLTHAPMISISHFVDRDGRVASEVTPGHRFCLECHVPQTEVSPPLGNTFRYMGNSPR